MKEKNDSLMPKVWRTYSICFLQFEAIRKILIEMGCSMIEFFSAL